MNNFYGIFISFVFYFFFCTCKFCRFGLCDWQRYQLVNEIRDFQKLRRNSEHSFSLCRIFLYSLENLRFFVCNIFKNEKKKCVGQTSSILSRQFSGEKGPVQVMNEFVFVIILCKIRSFIIVWMKILALHHVALFVVL